MARSQELGDSTESIRTLICAERGLSKLVSRAISHRPRLCSGLGTWIGMAAIVLVRSPQAPTAFDIPPLDILPTSRETIQGVLQQNYSLKLNRANRALMDDALLPEEPSAGIVRHEVSEGETLWHLTKMYQLDAAAIAMSNDINAQTQLEPGQTLFVPRTEGLIYTVNQGDTLETIAKAHEVSQAEIVAATPLSGSPSLSIGQRLVIPGKVEEILAVRNKVLNTLAASGETEWSTRAYAAIQATEGFGAAPASPPQPLTFAQPLTYAVAQGDTLVSISKQFDTTVRELMKANPNVRSTRLRMGQTLNIPNGSDSETLSPTNPPSSYQVQAGDTIETIASLHNTTVNNLIRANPTLRPNRLQVGQQLDIPGTSSPVAALPPATSSSGFTWPVAGRLSSGYGWRWGRMHNGIDIPGPYGSPIVATKAGTVIFAGWHTGGYGNMVKIQHADGLVTLYAHGTAIYVRQGQTVQQGQAIMTRGSTGWSTGPHLHFEVHLNNVPVNPMAYLQ